MRLILKVLNLKSILISLFTSLIVHGGIGTAMNSQETILPKTVGVWTRPASPELVYAENIFDYMNGAGELYVGYRFNHLEVFDYTSIDQHNIIVELYHMASSEDAYGLLSLDWSGEPIYSAGATTTALYGAGLLRVWSDNIYARILAYHETPATRQAVLSLGSAVTHGRRNPPKPELVTRLASQIDTDWLLRSDRLSFFRSHLVLNAIFYVSGENILDLNLSTQAVIAPYENRARTPETQRCQFLIIAYPEPKHAKQALGHFHGAYLPEYELKADRKSVAENPAFFELEDGWLAYKQFGNYVLIVFECPDQNTASEIIRSNGLNLK